MRPSIFATFNLNGGGGLIWFYQTSLYLRTNLILALCRVRSALNGNDLNRIKEIGCGIETTINYYGSDCFILII